MVLYTCPHCSTEFETAGHPEPSGLTCFNCNQRAEDPPDTAFDRMEGVLPPMEPQVWYTLDEAARYLRLPREIIRRLVIQRHLTAYRATGRGNERFKPEDLDALMQPVEVPKKILLDSSVMLSSALADLWDNELDAIYDFY